MGLAGCVTGTAGEAVSNVMAASLARLRGDYIGEIKIIFGAGVGGEGGGARASPVSQTIMLHAKVLRPALLVGPPSLAFGIVRVINKGKPVEESSRMGSNGHRVAVLHISNPTSVPASWSIKHIPSPPPTTSEQPKTHIAASLTASGLIPSVLTLSDEATGGGVGAIPWASLGLAPEKEWAQAPSPTPPIDDPSVFSFSALTGTLPGPTATPDAAEAAHTRASIGIPTPLALDVRFAPRAPVVYLSRFRFCVAHGESFEVTLSGRGTYEEII